MTDRDEKPCKELGKALGKLTSGVHLASCGRGDASLPFIASWVQQAAFDPPSLTIAIQEDRRALEVLGAEEGIFCLSILPEGGHHLMKPFFGEPDPENPFGGLETCTDPFGALYLKESLAWLSCRETGRLQVADHIVIAAEIRAGALLQEDGAPMVHIRKSGYTY